jgi:hypothetical protein
MDRLFINHTHLQTFIKVGGKMAKSLTSEVFGGPRHCAASGADSNSITVKVASVKAKNLSTGRTLDGVFKYNQATTASGLKTLANFIAGGEH